MKPTRNKTTPRPSRTASVTSRVNRAITGGVTRSGTTNRNTRTPVVPPRQGSLLGAKRKRPPTTYSLPAWLSGAAIVNLVRQHNPLAHVKHVAQKVGQSSLVRGRWRAIHNPLPMVKRVAQAAMVRRAARASTPVGPVSNPARTTLNSRLRAIPNPLPAARLMAQAVRLPKLPIGWLRAIPSPLPTVRRMVTAVGRSVLLTNGWRAVRAIHSPMPMVKRAVRTVRIPDTLARRLPVVRSPMPMVRRAAQTVRMPAFLTHRTRSIPVQTPESIDNRLKFLLLLFVLAFTILAFRAFDLTVSQHAFLKQRAQSQYLKRVTVPAYRGRILDRNGRTLAISLPVKSLSVDVGHVTNPDLLADQLAPVLNLPAPYLKRRLKMARPGSFPVLQHRLPPMAIRRIQQIEDPALFLTPEMQRFYPLGEITSHVLGFTNFDGKGMEGLERSFEKEIKGTTGTSILAHDRMGRSLPMGQVISEARPGNDVVLSIDANIQYIAYRTLLKGVAKAQAKGGMVVVMNPSNGEVYAMVNQPGFNPNNLSKSKGAERRNRVIADAYEPGSTFKIITVAAAIDLGLVKPTTVFDIGGGVFRIGNRTIHDFHRGRRSLNVSQIVETSSNVGAAKIGLTIGNAHMNEYISRFGFGKTTNIGLANESPGSVPNIAAYRLVGLANRSYGYGLTATPLQLAAATAAVVNGGQYYKPHLVLGKMVDGRMIPNERPESTPVIKPATSAVMRTILAMTVGPEGTAPKARIDGYTVAGKTGTARKSVGKQGYVRGLYFSSFVGYVPSENPKLLIFVGIDEPRGVFYGGLVAAPIFHDIAQEILPLLSIFPEEHAVPNLPAMTATGQDAKLHKKPGQIISTKQAGEDKSPVKPEKAVASKDRDKPADVLKNTLAKGAVKGATKDVLQGGVPEQEAVVDWNTSLIQLSLLDALEQLKKQKLVPRIEGHGRVARVEKGDDGQIRLFLK